MVCSYGNPKNRPPNKSLCAKGRQKKGLPLGGDPNRPFPKTKKTENDKKS